MNFTCETDGNCFSQIKKDEHTSEKEKVLGCLFKEPSGPTAIFQCKRGKGRKLEERDSVLCCYDKDFCNEHLKPTLQPTEKTTSK